MSVEKRIKYDNGNGNDNVIPIGPIPHEKPWYETKEGKKLIAMSDRSEIIKMLGGLTGQSEDYFKKFKTKDLLDELQGYINFRMSMKDGGQILSIYKKSLRKP